MPKPEPNLIKALDRIEKRPALQRAPGPQEQIGQLLMVVDEKIVVPPIVVAARWTFNKENHTWKLRVGKKVWAELWDNGNGSWYYLGYDELGTRAYNLLPKTSDLKQAKRKVKRAASQWLSKFLGRPVEVRTWS